MQETYYAGDYPRLDWGFITPNVTGALIASIVVAVWVLPWIWKHLFWVSLTASAVLGVFLVQTYSRGAFLGFGLGMIPVLICARRPFPFTHRLSTALVLGALIVFAASVGAAGRMESGVTLDDKSASNRLLIYREAPRMIWDQPMGWNTVGVTNAYRLYYQPPSYPDGLRHLVSTHFTWLAGWNYWQRALYVLVWCVPLAVFWPTPSTRWKAPLIGVWIVLAIGGILNHVAEQNWLIWVPAIVITIYGVVRLIVQRPWTRKSLWYRVILIPIILLITCHVCLAVTVKFLDTRSVPVTLEGDAVFLGDPAGRDNPDLAIFGQKDKLLGRSNGKTLRIWLSQNPKRTAAVCYPVDSVPQGIQAQRILFAGNAIEDWGDYTKKVDWKVKRDHLVFLNPSEIPETFTKQFASDQKITAVFGGFFNERSLSSWRAALDQPEHQIIMKNAGYFMETGFQDALSAMGLDAIRESFEIP